MTQRTTERGLIAFLDFTQFDKESQHVTDSEIADTLDAHYQRVTKAVRAAGGRVIKFIGDATMLVFPETAADASVRAILLLIASEDRLMAEKGWGCRLKAKAHVGSIISGEFGAVGDRRFDVFGRAVNATAKLKGNAAVTLSAEAYQRLSPELQRQFTQQADGNYTTAA